MQATDQVQAVDDEVDILIIGGGLMGMALMHALSPFGYRVRLAEARVMENKAHPTPDILETRSIALSPASLRILQQLKRWPALLDAAASIQTIHISEQGRFGQAQLHGDADEPLGAVVEMHVLGNALKADLNQADLLTPARLIALDPKTGVARFKTERGEETVRARWVIAADGAHSSVRALCQVRADYKTYKEHAIATNIALSRAHKNIAYERFTPHGPLALLPLKGLHMALVWTVEPKQAELLKTMKQADFLKALQRTFGYRTGRFLAVGRRETYPLQQVIMPEQVHHQVIFVGNAAHTLHPVAGQGFNLGLRDVAMLAECVARYDLTDKALAQYQTLRKTDQKIITTATDGLISLFKSKFLGVSVARRTGLLALDNSAFLKNLVLRHAKGFGGVVPQLVCGMPLDLN